MVAPPEPEEAMSEKEFRDDLAPCPFCGETAMGWTQGSIGFSVICSECAAEGPIEPTQDDADAAWNRRTPA